MTWYTAHLAFAIHPREAPTDEVFVCEDVFLLQAADRDAASRAALRLAEGYVGVDSKPALEGRRGAMQFLGVRKIVAVVNTGPDRDQLPPSNGTELTSTFFKVKSLEAARRLAAGAAVEVELVR